MSSEEVDPKYQQASIATANQLLTVATRLDLQQLSRLSLPEIERLSHEVARVVPAGNVPGIILSGLSRVGGREVNRDESRKHIGMLFKGVRQALDRAVYGAFFAGPAAVLYAYQQILALAGRDVEAAFPNGTWQFYLEFALRDDSARHANETTGFQQALADYNLALSEADQLAAWLLSAVNMLRDLPSALANEWDERVIPAVMAEVAHTFEVENAAAYDTLYSEWEKVRPYRRGHDAGKIDYPTYRRRRFGEFIQPYYETLPPDAREAYHDLLEERRKQQLPAYQAQMSWLAYLEPGIYQEERVSYAFNDAMLGVIWRGRYYLLPAKPLLDPAYARSWAAAILEAEPDQPVATLDEALVTARRSEHPALRAQLDEAGRRELETLRCAPILINWDMREANQPLAAIRQGKRGVGDHPLTIFRTEQSIVFDQSHIFFDGGWGSAVAEIMTSEAISWAAYLAQLALPEPADTQPIQTLSLKSYPAIMRKAATAQIAAETVAESTGIKLRTVLNLRKMLKYRNDQVRLTINDLLVLYRSLHTYRYQPSPELQAWLDKLASDHRSEVRRVHARIVDELQRLRSHNPAILIPIDASRYDPKDRLYPTTFRNPLTDLYDHHVRALQTLRVYKAAESGTRGPEFAAFIEAQVRYLRLLAGFSELLSRYREIAVSGQSTSTASIKFLGHMPDAMRRLLDTIPSRFDVLNEIIKGQEVFSNMGRVAAGSTLRRFITAKDDNEQKTLAWGVITDDNDVMHLSLRDFRPHVADLQALGMPELAQRIAQDYLDTYVDGFNDFVRELREITIASRETRIDILE